MVVAEDAVEVLFEPSSWSVLREPPGASVSIGHIRVQPPAHQPDVLAGAVELPALLLPPGAQVELRLPPDQTEPLYLRGGLGVDFGDLKKLPKGFRASFECTLERVSEGASETLFRRQLDVRGGNPDATGWVLIRDEDTDERFAVWGEERIRITTRLVSGGGDDLPRLGLGGLSLVRQREVAVDRAGPSEPNVVVVVMDTLRADHTSTFGYRFPTTPRLDELARRGTAFEDARSTSSWTWPSTASLFTGLQPAEHGLERPGSAWLRGALVTVPEHMQANGVRTAAFTGNRLISADFHFDQGFETFHSPAKNEFVDGDALMPPALAWLDEHHDERFFLYLHLVDPHRPCDPLHESVVALPGESPEGLGKLNVAEHVAELFEESQRIPSRLERPFLTSLLRPSELTWLDRSYDQAVHTGDVWLGVLLDRLEALGIADETIVIFTSDHGEEAYEHGDIGHGQALFPESVHVPLVIAGPGVPRGKRVAGALSNAGLYDYLRHVARGQSPDLVRTPLPDPGEAVFYATQRGQWDGTRKRTLLGIEEGGWALHFAPEFDQVRLFDLSADPQQFQDVAAKMPAVVSRLKATLLARMRLAAESRLGSESLDAGAGTLQTLKDIGYL